MNLTILLITCAVVATIILLGVLIMAPGKTNHLALSSTNSMDPSLKKLMKMFGGDIAAIIPSSVMEGKARDKGLQRIFNESANPWKVSIQEFVILQFILAGVGLIISLILMGTFTMNGAFALGFLLLPLPPFIFFNYPLNYYKSIAKERENKFKAQLPEAIDYLIMALSGGGYSLPTAFEISTKYLQEGIIKNEFNIIVNDIRAGKTIEMALQGFADRAPTDGIKAFCKALINANKLSVPMIDILRTRAQTSRKELETEIEKRVTTLPSKVTMIFSPSSAIALGLVVITPSVYTISQLL